MVLYRFPLSSEYPHVNKHGKEFTEDIILKLYDQLTRYTSKFGIGKEDSGLEAAESILYTMNTYNPELGINLSVYNKYCFRMRLFKSLRMENRKITINGQKVPVVVTPLVGEIEDETSFLEETLDMRDLSHYISSRYNETYARVLQLKLDGYNNKEIGDLIERPRTTINYMVAAISKELMNY